MLQILLGFIPEAIYFALFIIFTKQLKEKRILFIFLMIAEYLLLKYFLHYTVWFQIIYTFFTYLILKILYKEKAQITDIFTFILASVFLIVASSVVFILFNLTIKNMLLAAIVLRFVTFMPLFLFNYKLNKIQNIYKKLWNRNDKIKKKMKSTTFRCINIILFNITFYILNIVMLYSIAFYEMG